MYTCTTTYMYMYTHMYMIADTDNYDNQQNYTCTMIYRYAKPKIFDVIGLTLDLRTNGVVTCSVSTKLAQCPSSSTPRRL